MGMIQESDVSKVLADQDFMNQVVSGLVEDSATMDSLADEIADKVQDSLENDSNLRQQLIGAAMSNDAFKRKLVDKLIQELG